MQLIIMAAVNILFLALVCIGTAIERRVSKLEFKHEKETEHRETLARLKALEKRLDTDGDTPPEKDIQAEARFAKGVENILNYALTLPTAAKEES